jgi:predicted nucleic acid-binding protein
MGAALEKFKNQSQAVSLTDCIVMAVADHYGTKDIFGKAYPSGSGTAYMW